MIYNLPYVFSSVRNTYILQTYILQMFMLFVWSLLYFFLSVTNYQIICKQLCPGCVLVNIFRNDIKSNAIIKDSLLVSGIVLPWWLFLLWLPALVVTELKWNHFHTYCSGTPLFFKLPNEAAGHCTVRLSRMDKHYVVKIFLTCTHLVSVTF